MADMEYSHGVRYRRCGHCQKLVSGKTYKEHHRLYFHEGEWISAEAPDGATSSRESSPFSDTIHFGEVGSLISRTCSPTSAGLSSPCSSAVVSELDFSPDGGEGTEEPDDIFEDEASK